MRRSSTKPIPIILALPLLFGIHTRHAKQAGDKMKVHELIAVLQELPQNAVVLVQEYDECREPEPSQEWDDDAENYKVIL